MHSTNFSDSSAASIVVADAMSWEVKTPVELAQSIHNQDRHPDCYESHPTPSPSRSRSQRSEPVTRTVTEAVTAELLAVRGDAYRAAAQPGAPKMILTRRWTGSATTASIEQA